MLTKISGTRPWGVAVVTVAIPGLFSLSMTMDEIEVPMTAATMLDICA
jgi:hypothetical protein